MSLPPNESETPMTEHVILVALTVESPEELMDDSRETAERLLHEALPEPSDGENGSVVTSWWVAEDDRRDRSDCDSAVFVDPGRQAQANRVLHILGLQSRTGTSWQDDLPTHAMHAKGLDRALDALTLLGPDTDPSEVVDVMENALDTALDLLNDLGVFFGQVTPDDSEED